MALWGRSVPSRVRGKCKGPGAGVCLPCLRPSGNERVRWRSTAGVGLAEHREPPVPRVTPEPPLESLAKESCERTCVLARFSNGGKIHVT